MSRLILLLATASLWAQQPAAFTNVTVIDPQTRAITPNTTVLVENGKIREVGASIKVPTGFTVIDGAGKYLIPGLCDAHVHLTKAGEHALSLLIANGVTCVRDMGSDPEEVSRWRTEIQSGKRVGPRIKMAGPILESAENVARMKREGTVEPVDRIRVPVANPDEARAAVQKLVKLGVDHIKMRTTPDDATFKAAVDEAKRLGLPFTAHPIGSPESFIASGIRSAEHFLTFPALKLEEGGRRALYQRMVTGNVFMSTTFVNMEGSILVPYERGKQMLEDKAGKIDPRRKYVGGYLISDWREQVDENRERPLEEIRRAIPGLERDLREMRVSGVKFLTGTDVAVAFMYPGFSLHDELAIYVERLGFTPIEALRASTVNFAEFYGESSGIRQGQRADLVLLDASPLESIKNVTRIRGVMTAGRYFPRPDLDKLLKKAEQSFQ